MKVNVSVVTSVHSERAYSPTEVAMLVKDFLGKKVTPEVPGSTLVSGLISVLVIQLGLASLKATFDLEKEDAVLEGSKTLEEAGVTENDALQFRVILELS